MTLDNLLESKMGAYELIWRHHYEPEKDIHKTKSLHLFSAKDGMHISHPSKKNDILLVNKDMVGVIDVLKKEHEDRLGKKLNLENIEELMKHIEEGNSYDPTKKEVIGAHSEYPAGTPSKASAAPGDVTKKVKKVPSVKLAEMAMDTTKDAGGVSWTWHHNGGDVHELHANGKPVMKGNREKISSAFAKVKSGVGIKTEMFVFDGEKFETLKEACSHDDITLSVTKENQKYTYVMSFGDYIIKEGVGVTVAGVVSSSTRHMTALTESVVHKEGQLDRVKNIIKEYV